MKWICCMCHNIYGYLKCWSWYSFPHLEKSPNFDLVWPPFRAANPSFGLTFAYFLLTFLFVDKRNGWDYIYLNTKEVSLSFYSNSFTMNLRQRKQFLPLPGLQVISKHSSQVFLLKLSSRSENHTIGNLSNFEASLAQIKSFSLEYDLDCGEQTDNSLKRLQSHNSRL